jgi:hypothetical protein
MHITSQFSSAVLWFFFLLLNHKLRAGRTLVNRLIQHKTSVN